MTAQVLVEACVDSLEGATAAEASGAGRLELCGPGEGGLTPSPGLLVGVLASARIPVHVMIRPREGGFVYSVDELAAMAASVEMAKAAGAQGVVFGILTEDGELDEERMAQLIARARPMRVACHRAFDATVEADRSLEVLLSLGVDLVLTSGHAKTALEGAAQLRRHQEVAAGRMVILAGGGIRGPNVREVVAKSGVRELHARATDPEVFAAVVRALAS